AREADVGVEVSIGSDGEDKAGEEAESRDRGTIKIGVDRVSDIESAQRERGCRMLAASEQRAGMLDRIRVLEMDNKRLRGMLCVERERVDSLRRHMSSTQEELRQMRVDDNGNGNGDGGGNGNGNGLGGGNGDGNPNVNVGGVVPVAYGLKR
ncbi:hypothetical protein Tco_0029539, partial [Tanacetum coccineum]